MAQITFTLDSNDFSCADLTYLFGLLCGAKPASAQSTAPAETEQLSMFNDKTTATPEASTKPTSSRTKKTPAETPAAPPTTDAPAAPKISLTDVRAIALKHSKAGKQAELKSVFAKYGAEKLSDIAESDYPALLADLEALDG